MKILLIITRLDRGGSAEAVMRLSEGLTEIGHEVKIITGLTKEPQEDFENYTKRTGVPITILKELKREISPFLDTIALYKLYKMIKKEKTEIVHTHTSKAGILGRWAAWLCGTKVIIHSSHGHIFYGYFGRFKTRLFLLIEKLTAMITDRFTTLSSLEIEDYGRLRLAERKKFIAIPYGIDLKKYKKSINSGREVRKMFGISDGNMVIGWVGRLALVKDCGTFFKAASLIKNAHEGIKFLVVGDGTEREMLKEMAKGLGIEAIFTGMRDDIYDIMCAIDIFVLSSLNEGLGHVLIEAMAAGKPVVATKVGGVPEIVEDGITGILVPPSDPEGMAAAVMRMFANPKMMKGMGEEGSKRAERFDIEMAVKKLETLYKNVGQALPLH